MPCPTVTRCRLACFHRVLVESYRDARWAWESAAELATHFTPPSVPRAAYAHDRQSGMGAEELRDYSERNPPPLFKQWLINSAGTNAEPDAEPAEGVAA